MSRSCIRYAGVLNPLGRRLLNVCFETTEEQFKLHEEAPVTTSRIQVPEDPDVFIDSVDRSLEEED